MTPNPDCPDCHGAGEILMLHKMVPCACTERDEWLELTIEELCKVMLPAEAIGPSEAMALLGLGDRGKGLESVTINGCPLRPGEIFWLTQRGTQLTVHFTAPNRLLIDLN